jgi:hypothetical protein
MVFEVQYSPGSQNTQQRETILKTVHFEKPDYIPMVFHINGACWQHYPQQALQELMAEHPFLFPGFEPTKGKITPNFSPVQRKDHPYTDPWGCTWVTAEDGITGTVTQHPLADYAAFETYQPPDPERTDGLVPIDWDEIAEDYRYQRTNGELTQAALRHGHTFLQLCDIRGYQNVLFDMADDEPRLRKLIQMLEDFNLALVHKYVKLGVEWMSFPEDLGMQFGPMLSPKQFREYIKPSYQRLMKPALEANCIIHMHSDGDIRTLADDLVGSGVQVINLQDLVNGIDWVANRYAGKVCIDLDIDRQKVTPKGKPQDIDQLIREEVEKLGSKDGGLMMIYGLYPGVPLENVKALMDAMEKYAGYYA